MTRTARLILVLRQVNTTSPVVPGVSRVGNRHNNRQLGSGDRCRWSWRWTCRMEAQIWIGGSNNRGQVVVTRSIIHRRISRREAMDLMPCRWCSIISQIQPTRTGRALAGMKLINTGRVLTARRRTNIGLKGMVTTASETVCHPDEMCDGSV